MVFKTEYELARELEMAYAARQRQEGQKQARLDDSDAERERIAAGLTVLAKDLAREQTERDLRERTRRLAEARERSIQDRLAEYRGAGLEPPEVGPSGVVVSLALKLQAGYRIEEMDGRPVLVSPPYRPLPPLKDRPTKISEMGR